MTSLSSWLTLAGLGLDIVGFLIIAGELLKPPGSRRFYGGPYRRDLFGVGLVVAGFVLQGAGQAIGMMR